MAREYARIRVDIWADDDFRALPQPSQLLYLQLLSSPTLTYCGIADWRPKRIATLGGSWTAADVVEAALPLQWARLILIDEDTEEVLLRSFLRHDGVLQQARIAVTMAASHASIASATLRGVVVHELRRLHAEHPEWAGWSTTKGDPGEALALLQRRAVDPSTLSVPPHVAPTVSPQVGGQLAPPLGAHLGQTPPSVWGSASTPVSPAPAPAPAPAPPPLTSFGGDARTSQRNDHSPVEPDPHAPPTTNQRSTPPPPRCPAHTDLAQAPPCTACRDARQRRQAYDQREHDRRTAAPVVVAPPCPVHPDQPASRCQPCTAEAAGPPPGGIRRLREAQLRAS